MLDFIFYLFTFIIQFLLLYMFFRLISVLSSKNILNNQDIFYITSRPKEFKKRYKK